MTDDIILPDAEWVSLMENIWQLEELERRMLRERAQMLREIAELHQVLEIDGRLSDTIQIAMEILKSSATHSRL